MSNAEDTEVNSTLATLTSTAKVLAIGEPQEVIKVKNPEPKLDALNFKTYCTNHLSLLLMGNPTPIDDVSGQCPIEWFGMEIIRKANQPTCYKFYCFPAQKTEPKHVNVNYFYQTINANAILRDVKRLLKEQQWRSKNILMGPLKAKLNPLVSDPEKYYIETIISKAFDIERAKVFPYLMYFHREHVQNKQCR